LRIQRRPDRHCGESRSLTFCTSWKRYSAQAPAA